MSLISEAVFKHRDSRTVLVVLVVHRAAAAVGVIRHRIRLPDIIQLQHKAPVARDGARKDVALIVRVEREALKGLGLIVLRHARRCIGLTVSCFLAVLAETTFEVFKPEFDLILRIRLSRPRCRVSGIHSHSLRDFRTPPGKGVARAGRVSSRALGHFETRRRRAISQAIVSLVGEHRYVLDAVGICHRIIHRRGSEGEGVVVVGIIPAVFRRGSGDLERGLRVLNVTFVVPPRRAVGQRRKGDLRLYRFIRILPAALYALIRVDIGGENRRVCRSNTLDRYISVAICRLGAKRHLIFHRIFGVDVNFQRGLPVNVIDRPRRTTDSDAPSSGAAPAAAAEHERAAHALQDIAGTDAELHIRRVYVVVSIGHDNMAVFIRDFANAGSRPRGRETAQIRRILRRDVIVRPVKVHLDIYLVGVPAPLGGVSHILRDRHLVQLLIRVSLTVQRRLPP